MKTKTIYIIIFSFFFLLISSSRSLAVNIPQVYIEGNLTKMESKKDEREVLLKYKSDDLNFEKYTKIKVQGSSSLAYDKKNYTINLFENSDFEQKSKVDVGHGWGAQSKYNLKANWIDKSHSRNVVSAKITGKVQEKYGVLNDTPNHGSIDGFPVEVYLNNEFLGLYTWNIPKDAWMWNMDESNPEHIVLEGGWYTEYVNFKTQLDGFDGTGWDIEVGSPNEETVSNFNRLVRFINNSTDEEFVRDFDLYLNKDACLNYLLMLYLVEGVDNTGKNMMLVSYNNGQTWYPCLYDLDTTFGTWYDGKLSNSYEYLPESIIADHSDNNLFLRMIKCFPNEISDRWFEIRKDIFSKENILNEFNDFTNSIPPETFAKEAEKWHNIPGYGIDQIENFLNFRLNYIDNLMESRYTNNEKSNVFLFCFVAILKTGSFVVLLSAHVDRVWNEQEEILRILQPPV